ncbi:MAG TPA: hypothetical protein VID04_06090 [Methylomirabilota bacterium]|jgi:mannose-6-phosphate isomerase-like protein (cupin superfamily)
MDVVDVFAHRGQFFRVLQQTARSQTAVMTIAAGAEAGPGALVMVPAGQRHHVRNPGRGPLFFVTMYAPPAY